MIAALLAAACLGGAPAPVMVALPTGDAEAWISEALAERLPRELAGQGVAALAPQETRAALDALGLPPGPVSRATLIRTAQAIGAGWLLVGRIRQDGAGLRVELGLVDPGAGSLGPEIVAEAPARDVTLIAARLAAGVAAVLPASSKGASRAVPPAPPVEALRAHAEAAAAASPEDRREHLDRALAAAPDYTEARLTLARDLLSERGAAEALDVLAPVGSEDALGREAAFLRGQALLAVGRAQDAFALFAGLSDDDPTPGVLNDAGVARLRAGGAGPPASAFLRRAAESCPELTDVAFNLGWALLAEGDAAEAAFWLGGVVRRAPDDLTARLALAWALHRAGRRAAAEQEWRRVAGAVPDFESPSAPDLSRRYERSLTLERPRPPRAEEPSDLEVAASLAGRAEALLARGDAEAAAQALRRAAYLDPYGPRIHLLLARVLRAGDEIEPAVNELRMSLWCRDDPGVRTELAELLLGLGRAEEARQEAQRSLASAPDDPRARRIVEQTAGEGP